MSVDSIRIAFLADSVGKKAGGLNNSVINLSKSLCKKNSVDSCIISSDSNQVLGELKDSCVKTQQYSLSFPKFYGYTPNLETCLINSNTDIVHLQHLWKYPSVAVYKYSRRYKKPYVISPRGMIDAWALSNSSLKKKIIGLLVENKLLNRSSCLHALCDSEAESMRRYGLTNPICIIPNGIDIVERPVVPVNNNNGNNLLFLSRLHQKKGIENLLQAWLSPDLRNIPRFNNWSLKIAGFGDEQYIQYLTSLVNKSKYSSSVSFLGPLFDDDKKNSYLDANAFILPSFSEGLPMSVLEAWSYNLPVLISDECNLPDAFTHQSAINSGNSVESIKHSIERLVALSDAERADLGSNGKQLVYNRYNWTHISNEMFDVYQWLLGRSDKPDCVYLS